MGSKPEKITNFDPIELMKIANSKLDEFDLKINDIDNKIENIQNQIGKSQLLRNQKIDYLFKLLNDKLEKKIEKSEKQNDLELENRNLLFELIKTANLKLNKFDLKIKKTNKEIEDLENKINSSNNELDQKIDFMFNQLNEKIERISTSPAQINSECSKNEKNNYRKSIDISNKQSGQISNNNILTNNQNHYSYSWKNKTENIIQNVQNISTIPPIQTLIKENPYYINEKLLEKINIYLFGIKKETEVYFEKITDNFKFIKPIDTDFITLKNSIQKSLINIKKPCLTFFLSPDYRGRLPDEWEAITEFIFQYTDGNLVMIKLKDPYKNMRFDGDFSHGINKNKIEDKSIFKINYQSPSLQQENGIDSNEIDILLSKIKNSILERVNNL